MLPGASMLASKPMGENASASADTLGNVTLFMLPAFFIERFL
jgi:hypothetical protein